MLTLSYIAMQSLVVYAIGSRYARKDGYDHRRYFTPLS